MNNTPQSNRTHIGIFGETNSGKSSLFNAITNTNISIVSDVKGTTTDPVTKAMELIPYGPVVFIDTAGLNDNTELGLARIDKTLKSLNRINYAIYVADINLFDLSQYESMQQSFNKKNINHILVFSKIDIATNKVIENYKSKYKNAIFLNTNNKNDIENLRTVLVNNLQKSVVEEPSLLEGILDIGNHIVMVAPIDSEAPKGRLILPQTQLIRSSLDNGITCSVCTVDTLQSTIDICKRIDLVVTDSQVFGEVDSIVCTDIPLTSFSILMARQKADIDILIDGTNKISNLQNGDKILISEVCTHNISHEDIGRVKIPKLLKQKTGKDLIFDFVVGRDYPDNIGDYSLIVHCGGCMITRKEMENRLDISIENNVPIANYGTVLAYCNGILERSIEILK